MQIGGKTYTIGQPVNEMIASLGTVTETMQVPMLSYDATFYVFASTPANTVIAITDGSKTVGFYAPGSSYQAADGITGYTYRDSIGTSNTYAVLMLAQGYSVNFNQMEDRSALSAMAKLSFHITNALRGINGIAPLQWSATVASVAYAHSNEMATLNYFDHDSPNYGSVGERLNAVGINFFGCGENIAAGQQGVFAMMNDWYNSSAHRKNILNASYEYVGSGFAYVDGNALGVYGTQDFYYD